MKIDDNGFSIKHEELDLYSKETIDSSEYYWFFDVQPEMKELLIQFIQTAIK